MKRSPLEIVIALAIAAALVIGAIQWMSGTAEAAPRDDIRVLQGQVAAQQKAIELLTARVVALEKPIHVHGIKPASAVRAMAAPRSAACQTELNRISGLIDAAVTTGQDFIEPRGEYLRYVPDAPWGPSPLLEEVMRNLQEAGYDVGLLNYDPTTFALVVRWGGN